MNRIRSSAYRFFERRSLEKNAVFLDPRDPEARNRMRAQSRAYDWDG
jgi:hypothetical protein